MKAAWLLIIIWLLNVGFSDLSAQPSAADAKQLDLEWARNSSPDLSYRKGVEIYVDRYWKIQRGEVISGFDSRWIFPE